MYGVDAREHGMVKVLVRVGWSMALGVLCVGVGLMGYRFVRADIESQVYRERLRDLTAEYESLRSNYNHAVRRTAVTELVVEDGRLNVRIREADGSERIIPTPFDPAGEIYADYIVRDGRIWIRRVFDEITPPSKGILIDPDLIDVPWGEQPTLGPGPTLGKAVYRSLGEGRWVVTVTGDGSLGLRRAPLDQPAFLEPAPPLRDFEEMEREAREQTENISWSDVWRAFVGGPSVGGGS